MLDSESKENETDDGGWRRRRQQGQQAPEEAEDQAEVVPEGPGQAQEAWTVAGAGGDPKQDDGGYGSRK